MFAASNLLIPRHPVEAKSANGFSPRQPEFLVPQKFFRFHWSELLGTLFCVYPQNLKNISAEQFREIPILPRRFAGRPFALSLFVHLAGIPLLPFLLQVIPTHARVDNSFTYSKNEVLYYYVPKPAPKQRVPKLSPFGPGSAPGVGNISQQVPIKGATKSLGSLFAISRPRVPDNNHQTIIQPNTPADLRIKNDLKLPNIISDQSSPAKPRMQYRADTVRPMQPKQREIKGEAPSVNAATPAQLTSGLPGVPATQARLAVPIGAALAPVVPTGRGKGGDIEGGAPSFDSGEGAGGNGVGGNGTQGLLILSTDPAPPSEVVSLPAGNRHGQFSIAPGGGGLGSPGGVEGGTRGGGSGGSGTGGNDSSGVGAGSFGGGGGNSAKNSGFVSLKGYGGGEVLLADPGPGAISQMVYPIPVSAMLRHNRLVVSAGPIGGGGSNVYGELPCGKIYTIFLSTAGKQWSLQYCERTQGQIDNQNKARTTVVHTELPLVPPEAQESYDFVRLPLPPEKAHKMIILRGAIDEEGKVQQVEVHQGLLPAMDAAAKLAFSQWKFKPAMRSGKPMRVEILVAIPSDPPKTVGK